MWRFKGSFGVVNQQEEKCVFKGNKGYFRKLGFFISLDDLRSVWSSVGCGIRLKMARVLIANLIVERVEYAKDLRKNFGGDFGIIFTMLWILDEVDFAVGAAALNAFVSKAKYAEMIVDIAFAVVPTILGFGAAGIIGSSAIKTARGVMDSISLLNLLGKLERIRFPDRRPPGGGGGGR